MRINGKPHRTIWSKLDDPAVVQVIDQRYLPHRLVIRDLSTYRDGAFAIKEMLVRGAPLIGATAAWSLYLAAVEGKRSTSQPRLVEQAAQALLATRPTAVNLRWAVKRMQDVMASASDDDDRIERARVEAQGICDEDVEICRAIGDSGLPLIEKIAREKGGQPVNILTHCNAGWLATIDWGTATAPVYLAHQSGIPVHVWVDETRPRNQGSQLTAWELAEEGIPHTVIVDNAGGHIMQHRQVDLCITGTDRTARSGDVANKIGTYLKALAAFDNEIPFYVALPSTSIDWAARDGLRDTPIEERPRDEVTHLQGVDELGELRSVRTVDERTPVKNYGFDVTPRRLITGLITERGVCKSTEEGLTELFPDLAGGGELR